MALPAALPTSLVGSYAQPDWLIDRERLRQRFPPRVRARELWRVDPQYLEQAQDDATLLAIRDQERAGLDIITDGETAPRELLEPVRDRARGRRHRQPGHRARSQRPPQPGAARGRPDRTPAPRPGARRRVPARKHRAGPIKITVPGPFTMSQQAQNDYYESDAELALAYAAAVNDEIADLFAAGADIVQIDEPYMQARPEKAREYGLAALAAGARRHRRHHRRPHLLRLRGDHPRPAVGLLVPARAGGGRLRPDLDRDRAVGHRPGDPRDAARQDGSSSACIDLDDEAVESPEAVAERIRRALPYKRPQELVAAPDCGMKYLPRDSAYGKLESLVAGAAAVRDEG